MEVEETGSEGGGATSIVATRERQGAGVARTVPETGWVGKEGQDTQWLQLGRGTSAHEWKPATRDRWTW